MEEELMNLYPDLLNNGGLSAAVDAQLAAKRKEAGHPNIGSVVRGGSTWTAVQQGARTVQITIAAKQRLFLSDFWDQGVRIGSLASPDLGVLVLAAVIFLAGEASIHDIKQRFPQFTPTPQAESHEAGILAEVASQWEAVKRVIESDWPDLLPLADALSQQWPFSHLFPYISQDALCFSRHTGYPYSGDCPVVVCTHAHHFEVRSNRGELLGEGDQQAALKLLHASLIPGCGPAIQGAIT